MCIANKLRDVTASIDNVVGAGGTVAKCVYRGALIKCRAASYVDDDVLYPARSWGDPKILSGSSILNAWVVNVGNINALMATPWC